MLAHRLLRHAAAGIPDVDPGHVRVGVVRDRQLDAAGFVVSLAVVSAAALDCAQVKLIAYKKQSADFSKED